MFLPGFRHVVLCSFLFSGLTQRSAAQSVYTPYDFTTLAGRAGSAGSVDGVGADARFSSPYGIAVDGSGNLYVADRDNHTIRKITPGGVVTTWVGMAGSFGSADGVGATARFSFPAGLAVDENGNVYVADAGNSTIRKITPTGIVTTIAGEARNTGSANGVGAAARFRNPRGVAVGGGNIYVADGDNSTIRKITSEGLVTTLAGTAGAPGSVDGVGAAARFDYPWGIAVDLAGNVYVADSFACLIRKITPAGVVTTLAGAAEKRSSQDGQGAAARFYAPTGLAVDGNGNLFVADVDNSTIRKITPGGVVTTVAGAPQPFERGSSDGGGAAVRFSWPHAVAVDGNGTLYVADDENNAIRVGHPSAASGSRLFAISCRAVVGVGGDVLIPGFIIGGSGQRQVIVRVSGPAIQGISGKLAQPRLDLYRVGSSVPVATNTGWSSGTEANTTALRALFLEAGLPAYPTGSADCALLATLDAGTAYTAVASGVNSTTGVALVELYEVGNGMAQMTALSSRARVGVGDNILIAGIIIRGNVPKRVLIRGNGPAIQGVGGVLDRPYLYLFSGATMIGSNSSWRSAPNSDEIFAVTPTCGLANFPSGSNDSAILVTLPPGAYTAQLGGMFSTAGVGMIEVYEVP